MALIEPVELALGITAQKQFLPMQSGDMQATAADSATLKAWTSFKSNTQEKSSMARFVEW